MISKQPRQQIHSSFSFPQWVAVVPLTSWVGDLLNFVTFQRKRKILASWIGEEHWPYVGPFNLWWSKCVNNITAGLGKRLTLVRDGQQSTQRLGTAKQRRGREKYQDCTRGHCNSRVDWV